MLEAAGFRWDPPVARDFEDGLAALDRHLAGGSGPWVPVQFTAPDGFRLGAWLSRQRIAWRRGVVALDDAGALAARGVSPSYDQDRLMWGLRRFVQFRVDHPGRLPSGACVDVDGFTLGAWFTVRRRELRAGTLHPAVAAAFAEAGVTVDANPRSLRDGNEARFAAALDAYRAWTASTGRRYPPRGTRMPDGRDLSVWVTNQRIDLRLGRTTRDRRAALATAGLDFPAARGDSEREFRAAVAGLRAFVAEHGYDGVPVGVLLADGRSLGTIVRSWRRSWARGELSVARAAELEAAGLAIPGPLPRRRRPGRPTAPAQPPTTLGGHLRAWRTSRGMSALDVAVVLGVSAATVHVLEQGRRTSPPRLALVGRIADLIGLDRPGAALLGGWPRDEVAAIFGVGASAAA